MNYQKRIEGQDTVFVIEDPRFSPEQIIEGLKKLYVNLGKPFVWDVLDNDGFYHVYNQDSSGPTEVEISRNPATNLFEARATVQHKLYETDKYILEEVVNNFGVVLASMNFD